MEMNTHPSFIFFGTPDFAVTVLEELKAAELLPARIVTTPDKPQGRGMRRTSPPVKVWAEKHDIPVIQPATLHDPSVEEQLREVAADVFVVVAYGKLIPGPILSIPPHGILNIHPSLLPTYRGPSPIEAQILHDDRITGVTIMQIDAEMDHGPLLAQTQITIEKEDWPLPARELGDILAHEGGVLLAHILPRWVAGAVPALPQDHRRATYCSLIKKEDAAINLSDDPYQNFLKIRAYDSWPKAYFFVERGGKRIRVKVTDAEYVNGTLTITRVIPEGKKETRYENFLRSY